jgi:hypothetical protein
METSPSTERCQYLSSFGTDGGEYMDGKMGKAITYCGRMEGGRLGAA